MCLIIDANIANLILTENPDCCFKYIHEWLFKGKGHIVMGGKLALEIGHSDRSREMLRVLNQSGRARTIPNQALEETIRDIENTCKSDDPHVLAVAIVSKARLLCTRDSKLRMDFKNKELINNPKGSLYPTNNISLMRHKLIIGLHSCNSRCTLTCRSTRKRR